MLTNAASVSELGNEKDHEKKIMKHAAMPLRNREWNEQDKVETSETI